MYPGRASAGGRSRRSRDHDLGDAICRRGRRALARQRRARLGDILVFLPGEREIREAAEQLRKHLASRSRAAVEMLPLFARLSQAEQDARVRRRTARAASCSPPTSPRPRSRCPASATSSTAGTARDQALQLSQQGRAAADRADQPGGGEPARRALRARRRRHLHPPLRRGRLRRRGRSFTDPEIVRSSLAGVILRMKSLNLGSVEDFPFLEAPPRRAIADGYQLLGELGAIDEPERADDDRPRARAPAARPAHRPHDPRGARPRGAARGADHRQRAERPGRARPPARAQQAADQAHAKFDDEKSEFLGTLKLWKWLEHSRRRRTASIDSRAASTSSCCATTSSRRAACANGATSTRSCSRSSPSMAGASTRSRADLRAAAPVDARRPARQHRRQERRGRVVPRRARHPLLAPSRRAPVEEARALDRRRRAGRDDAALRARHRRDRAAAGCRSSPATASRRSCSSRTGRRRRRRSSRSSGRRSTASSSTPTGASTSATVDPAAAREIFIREALVGGEWETKLPFLGRQPQADRARSRSSSTSRAARTCWSTTS